MDGDEGPRISNSANNIESCDSHLLEKYPKTCWETEVPLLPQSQYFHTPAVITLLYAVIVTLSAALIFFLSTPTTYLDPSITIYSPAEHVISYKTHVFAENFETKGPYMGSATDGLPNDITDALWEDLYQYGVSAISAADAAKLPNKTSSVPSRPNEFVIELDVFHQLHCLNTLRKTFFPDRYRSEFQDYYTLDGQRNYTSTAARHYDHCIDSIRQSIMCHGDIATVYWQWRDKRQIPLPSLAVTHTCRDFEAIKKWAKEHMIVNDEVVLKWEPGPVENFLLSG